MTTSPEPLEPKTLEVLDVEGAISRIASARDLRLAGILRDQQRGFGDHADSATVTVSLVDLHDCLSRVRELEEALRRTACGCDHPCERPAGEQDDSCRARQALEPSK
jgi:hypothetical protein